MDMAGATSAHDRASWLSYPLGRSQRSPALVKRTLATSPTKRAVLKLSPSIRTRYDKPFLSSFPSTRAFRTRYPTHPPCCRVFFSHPAAGGPTIWLDLCLCDVRGGLPCRRALGCTRRKNLPQNELPQPCFYAVLDRFFLLLLSDGQLCPTSATGSLARTTARDAAPVVAGFFVGWGGVWLSGTRLCLDVSGWLALNALLSAWYPRLLGVFLEGS